MWNFKRVLWLPISELTLDYYPICCNNFQTDSFSFELKTNYQPNISVYLGIPCNKIETTNSTLLGPETNRK